MKLVLYNCAVAWTLVGLAAVVSGKVSQALLVKALGQVKQKPFSARIPLNLATKQRLVSKGFITSIAAVCKYGRDNQPNDASGSATRTRIGGNGGRVSEPVREQSSLLSQAFLPIAGGLCKSDIAISEGWLRKGVSLKGERQTY